MIAVTLCIAIPTAAGAWRVFEKAGLPGWAVLLPVCNRMLILRLVGRPWWWLLLLLIPAVNLVIGGLMCLELAERFGKDPWFALGLVCLFLVFWPILGYGDARYSPPDRWSEKD